MEKTCDTCMLKKKNECFGEGTICEFYKHSPNVSKSEIDSWPEIMRSNSMSRHVERKKEQQKLAQRAKTTRSHDRMVETNQTPSIYNNTVEKKTESKKEIKGKFANETVASQKSIICNKKKEQATQNGRVSIQSIRNSFSNVVYVWISVSVGNDKNYYGEYVLEYNGKMAYGRTESHPSRELSMYFAVINSISRITEKNITVYFVSSISLETFRIIHENEFWEIARQLKQKNLQGKFGCFNYLEADLSSFVRRVR